MKQKYNVPCDDCPKNPETDECRWREGDAEHGVIRYYCNGKGEELIWEFRWRRILGAVVAVDPITGRDKELLWKAE